ncbi:MAG: HlyD family efflux transporter periplasmic adaptor subunit [Eubacterium sp.]|nr:HlyD family efflux transporter periplasmic adaptor subunit [Eubacterium sp.]
MNTNEQNEGLSVRKKIVKRFSVIFFVVLIILTFFSNTIMNYSLPEVSTETVFAGSVSKKVKCQGAVEVSNDLEVTVSGKRVVKEIMFEEGDTVEVGDVIMTFEETENTELAEAEKELETLEDNYTKQTLRTTKDYTDQEVQISNAQDDVSDATDDLNQARTDAANLETAKAERDELQAQYDAKSVEVEGIQTKVDSYESLSDYYQNATATDALVSSLGTAKEELAALEISLEEKKTLVSELEGKTTVEAAQEALTSAQQNLASLQRTLAETKENDSITDQTNAIDDANALEEIEEQKAKIEKLKAQDDCKEIKAKEAGIITGITVKPGDTIEAETPIANIQLTQTGYEVSAVINKQQSRLLKVGDEASIENLWGSEATASIKSIKADPTNPNQSSVVKFSVLGDVQVGETLQFAVGEKSGKYDTVVPNSAVKEESDGKFVFVVKVKATPLGNRYVTKKVKVEVVASDTVNSAVSGDLSEYDNIIINSSKPLDNGQQVRLSDN